MFPLLIPSSLLFLTSISMSPTINGQQKREQQQQKLQEKNRICPLDEHVVCNENEKSFRCVCTMFGSTDPPPDQSCTNLLNFTGHRGDMLEAASARLRIKPAFFPTKLPPNTTTTSNWADNYLEDKFKALLASNFRIHQKNIVFLRLRCQEDGSSDVVVQFVVLRKNRRRISPPLSKQDLVSTNTVVNRIKGMRDMQRVGGMEIVYVEKVNELLPVEVDTENSRLITQAIVVGTFIILTSLCGCWVTCRRRNPEDEGYADVGQQGANKV